ncbi:hypothetical protein FHS27_006498, partial [Rhodopirellula rubra]
EQLLLKGCFQQSVTRPFHHQYKTAALAAYLNKMLHQSRVGACKLKQRSLTRLGEHRRYPSKLS